MALSLCCMLVCAACLAQSKADEGDVLVVFWNLENFFDYRDGGAGESDREFSSMGGRRWTKKRFYAKCDAVAKAVLWMRDRYGGMPDVIGLAEVENRWVLSRLLNVTLLRKYDYRIVHHESGDRRGIDVALLYRESVFDLVSEGISTPVDGGSKMSTRDILYARLIHESSDTEYHFMVNHHPSKYGGADASEGRRNAAMSCLKALCDSLATENASARQIIMGDFNDTPDAPQFSIMDGRHINKGLSVHEAGEGTIRYEGKWELIDMFIVSSGISENSDMEICRIPFLMTYDRKHPGEKPLRTYSGPRYTGGVSDHCPIVLKVEKEAD